MAIKKFNLDDSENQESSETEKLKVFGDTGSDVKDMISQLNSALIEKCKEFNKDESGKWRYSVLKSAKNRWNIQMQYVQFRDFEEGNKKVINFYLGIVSYLLNHTEKVSIEITKDSIEIKTK
jgi:hypothetical protein